MVNRRKNKDYTLAQWPDDLGNTDKLSSPYHCCTCKRPCHSLVTLRTHKCVIERSKTNA